MFTANFLRAALIGCIVPAAMAQSIPPNYGFYELNPEYKSDAVLGWAGQRIEEKLGRGMVAMPMGEGSVYIGWRLLKADPEGIGFNLYRSSAGGEAVRLNDEPIRATTDFVDANAPLGSENEWWVRPVIDGNEGEQSGRTRLPANPPERQYKSFRVRDDIPEDGVHKIGIGDLNGDGEYDFVIKRPRGRVDPGRVRRSPDTSEDNQVARALVADIDPSHPGMECWGDKFFYSASGEELEGPPPPQDGVVWWDADPLREIQTKGAVSKWKGGVLTEGIEGTVMAWADILGDWREEIVTYHEGELRVYTTVIPAADRRVCLMQDPLYRIDVALKTMGYDQVPMTSYYLGSREAR